MTYNFVEQKTATHSIPIEFGPTNIERKFLANVHTFAGSPLRLFLDQGVIVTLCSFHSAYPTALSRIGSLHLAVEEANLSVSEIHQLIENGFRNNFLPFQQRKELIEKARKLQNKRR